MAELSQQQISSDAAVAAASLQSELSEIAVAASSTDLDSVAESASRDLAMAASPSSHVPLVSYNNTGANASHPLVSSVSSVAALSLESPPTALATSSTPPTPQSHGGSESSPGLLDSSTLTVLPPPYSAGASALTADPTAAITVPLTSDGLANFDPVVVAPSVAHLPPPPKKPLTPYMRFSKSIWQKVKAANQNYTVCEIGATIGRLWREMTDIDKQQYNDDFAHDKARYDGELQVYLKATGLQASDLVKAKVKKSKPTSTAGGKSTASSYTGSSPSHADGKPDGYPDTGALNGSDGVSYAAANGLAAGAMAGTALPHFSQVWSSTAQDVAVYNADQLLAQMTANGQTHSAAGLYHASANTTGSADAGVLLTADGTGQTAVYHDGALSSIAGAAQLSSVVSTSTSQVDQAAAAAMTNWLWQYSAAAAAAAASSTTDPQYVTDTALQQQAAVNAVGDASVTNGAGPGGVIVYQLSADGTPTAAYAPAGSADLTLEPGEVRLPPVTAASQTNGVAGGPTDQRLYGNTADYGAAAWVHGGAPGTTVDSEKQLLRGALVDKVREIQRLTRELEQAYALIHQLKQHSEFLHRQWGQIQVTSDATPQ